MAAHQQDEADHELDHRATLLSVSPCERRAGRLDGLTGVVLIGFGVRLATEA